MSDQPNPEVAILNTALELPAAARAAYLDTTCAGNAALRQQVEALLRAHEQAEGFLESPPAGLDFKRTDLTNVPLTEKPGDKIGRYKLLQQIGEGGCGVVYMAEQEEPVRRRVALKIIKLGMDTKQVIARFEAERQALALMDHPNIAKVLDAGATDTGRPYFVMELVRGIKITEFCDENEVSTEERLKLFIQVCQAIQHAHQKGIIHRDIKPSNILVTVNDGVPVPKVIDFGIVKATQGRLTDKTLFTAFEQFIGTPAYMSPEQAVMTSLDIDTRSDIYSLGVLLYELLTGKTPFDAKELLQSGLDEMRRTILEIEPPKPSTRLSTMLDAERTTTARHRQTESPKLIHLLRGDLDWIVMKSLEKDRARRYETANGFAADIQRHLNNEPVNACPPSGIYRLQKAVRRNKGAFAAMAVIAIVLVIGVVVSTSQAIRATRAEREQIRLRKQAEADEKKAQTEAAKIQQVALFLKDMLKGVGPSVALGRDTTMLREIVDKTGERIGTDLKDQPEVELELRFSLTQVYMDLQLYKKMEESARETLRLARAHFGEENIVVADALAQEGRALMFLRENDEAERITRQAITMERKLRGEGSAQEGAALMNLGDVLRHRQGTLVEAETAYRASLAIRRKQLGNDNDEVGWNLYTLATLLGMERRSDEAVAVQQEALAIRRKIHGDEHPYTGEDYSQLGRLLSDSTNRIDEAVNYLRKGLDIMKRTEGAGKNYRQVWAETSLALVLSKQGKLAEAEIHFRAAVTIARTQEGTDYPDTVLFILNLGNILRREGKLAEARALAEEAVAICQRIPNHIEPSARQDAPDLLRAVLTDQGDAAALAKLDFSRQTEVKPEAPPTPAPPPQQKER